MLAFSFAECKAGGEQRKDFKVENTQNKGSFRKFLDERGISLSPKFYFVDVMGAMALGLFASLLIGTIFGTLATYTNLAIFSTIATYAKAATGMAIGVAIAHKLGAHPLVIYSCAAVGAMANAMGAVIDGGAIVSWAATAKAEGLTGVFYSSGPAGAFFAVVIACEIAKLVSKRTKVDILVTPVVTLVVGFGASWLLTPIVSYVMYYLGVFIASATTYLPFVMGIIVSVVMGVVLTLPISSAAICAMIFSSSALEVAVLNGTSEGFLLAGGACVAGCCAQMVGFAAASFRENGWGGVVAQGIGTSMLQMGNIVKNPLIWIPATLASAITGPISTCLFKLECIGVSAGMGTCGFVGPIGVFSEMGFNTRSIVGVIVVCIVLPAVLSLVFSEIMRKFDWIKTDDMKLDM
jgi:uncharacterized membrane protein